MEGTFRSCLFFFVHNEEKCKLWTAAEEEKKSVCVTTVEHYFVSPFEIL